MFRTGMHLLARRARVMRHESSFVRRLHFSWHPGIMIGQIETLKLDRAMAREPDFRQLARSAQDGPAGCVRLEPAARDLSAAHSTLAQPRPGLGDESADLAQEVLVVVFREVPRFDRQREGSFRAWLRQVTVNKIRNYRRKRHRRPAVGLDPADGFLERLSDPNDDLAREWDRDHDKHVVDKLLAVVQPHFTPTTWEAFQRFGVDGVPAGRGGRGTGPVRERGHSCQVSGAQAVTGRSRRPLVVNSGFSRQVRRGTGLSSSETVARPVPGDRPMNAHPVSHPTDQTLSSYGLGKLDDDSAEAVNQHLEQCPDCRKRVAEMSADSFLGRIRDAQKPAGHSAWGGTGVVPSSVLARIAATVGQVPHVLLRDSELENGPGPIVKLSSTEIPELSERPDRYQLFGEIARGGMGAVLKGRDPDLGRDLAVKVLLESHRDKPELIRRFIEEAQIGGQLQHPGIVPIYELGTFADRRPVFRHEAGERADAVRACSTSGRDPARELPRFLSIFEAVCQTIAYAHARGVIHRDLKPSNIMVGSFGEVQVMDWGLAKVLPQGGAADDAAAGKTRARDTVIATARSAGDADSDLSRAGSVMGTPSYMAPEQARGEVDRLDERCDVFALGSILCEILTGEPAFTGRSSGEIQRKASRGELKEAIDRLDASGVDSELIALAKDCLAPELEDRPRHAGEVAARINAYQTGVQERLRLAEIAGAEEKARAEEATKRARVERDRLRLTVALAASVLWLWPSWVAGGAFWLVQQRQARLTGVESDPGTDSSDPGSSRSRRCRPGPLGRGARGGRPGPRLDRRPGRLAARPPPGRPPRQDRRGTGTGRARPEAHRGAGQPQDVRGQEPIWDLLSRRTWIDASHRAFKRYGLDLETTPVKDAVARLKSRPEAFVREVVGSLDHWLISRKTSAIAPEQEPQLLDLQKNPRARSGSGPRPRTQPASCSPEAGRPQIATPDPRCTWHDKRSSLSLAPRRPCSSRGC